MEQKTLRQIGALYDAVPESENALGNSNNLVVEMHGVSGPIILRVSAYSTRKLDHIAFELEWLAHLSKGMDAVAKPIPSREGNLWEVVADGGGKHIACAFEKALGNMPDPTDPAQWNGELFTALGKVMGRMHRLSREYALPEQRMKAQAWDRDFFFDPLCDFPAGHPAQKQWERILSDMRSLPKSPDCYGVIHNDLHHQNFFVREGRIKVFDFDDCLCSWYTYDIALTLFQSVMLLPPGDRDAANAFADRFLRAFLAGYRHHCDLDRAWLERLDLLLRYRRIGSYRFIRQLLSGQPQSPHQGLLEWLGEEVAAGYPVVELDWRALL